MTGQEDQYLGSGRVSGVGVPATVGTDIAGATAVGNEDTARVGADNNAVEGAGDGACPASVEGRCAAGAAAVDSAIDEGTDVEESELQAAVPSKTKKPDKIMG